MNKNIGRPKKNEEFKRNKAFLLKMKKNEYDIIVNRFVDAQKHHKVDSLTDFIIKAASGIVNV